MISDLSGMSAAAFTSLQTQGATLKVRLVYKSTIYIKIVLESTTKSIGCG